MRDSPGKPGMAGMAGIPVIPGAAQALTYNFARTRGESSVGVGEPLGKRSNF